MDLVDGSLEESVVYSVDEVPRCAVCGRSLSSVVSVTRGVGPVCWRSLKTEGVLEPHPWAPQLELVEESE